MSDSALENNRLGMPRWHSLALCWSQHTADTHIRPWNDFTYLKHNLGTRPSGEDECAEIVGLSRAYLRVVEEAGLRSLPLTLERG